MHSTCVHVCIHTCLRIRIFKNKSIMVCIGIKTCYAHIYAYACSWGVCVDRILLCILSKLRYGILVLLLRIRWILSKLSMHTLIVCTYPYLLVSSDHQWVNFTRMQNNTGLDYAYYIYGRGMQNNIHFQYIWFLLRRILWIWFSFCWNFDFLA